MAATGTTISSTQRVFFVFIFTVLLYNSAPKVSKAYALQVSNATFSVSGNSIFLRFSEIVNSTGTVNCSMLFADTSKLGNTSECFWSDDRQLTILLGYYATISRNDTLTLLAGTVFSGLNDTVSNPPQELSLFNFPTAEDNVAGALPYAISVQQPEVLSSCGDEPLIIRLIISNLNPMRMRFKWKLVEFRKLNTSENTSNFTVSNELQAIINSAQSELRIPNSMLAANYQFLFKIQINDSFGNVHERFSLVPQRFDPYKNIFLREGSEVVIHRSETLRLRTVIKRTACWNNTSLSELEKINITWRYVPPWQLNRTEIEKKYNHTTATLWSRLNLHTNVSIPSLFANKVVLNMPVAKHLKAGAAYIFQALVSGHSMGGMVLYLTCLVQVNPLPLFAAIDGSTTRLLPYMEEKGEFRVRAHLFDPEANGGLMPNCEEEITWSCALFSRKGVLMNGTACFHTDVLSKFNGSTEIFVPKLAFYNSTGPVLQSVYRFKVFFKKCLRKATFAVVNVLLTTENITQVEIRHEPFGNYPPYMFSTSKPILLKSIFKGRADYSRFRTEWSLVTPGPPNTSKVLRVMRISERFGDRDLFIGAVIKLHGGRRYDIQLKLEDTLTGTKSFARLHFVPFGPPLGGYCQSRQSIGDWNTSFELRCDGWASQGDFQWPLNYAFAVVSSASDSEDDVPRNLLVESQMSPILTTRLPYWPIFKDSIDVSRKVLIEATISHPMGSLLGIALQSKFVFEVTIKNRQTADTESALSLAQWAHSLISKDLKEAQSTGDKSQFMITCWILVHSLDRLGTVITEQNALKKKLLQSLSSSFFDGGAYAYDVNEETLSFQMNMVERVLSSAQGEANSMHSSSWDTDVMSTSRDLVDQALQQQLMEGTDFGDLSEGGRMVRSALGTLRYIMSIAVNQSNVTDTQPVLENINSTLDRIRNFISRKLLLKASISELNFNVTEDTEIIIRRVETALLNNSAFPSNPNNNNNQEVKSADGTTRILIPPNVMSTLSNFDSIDLELTKTLNYRAAYQSYYFRGSTANNVSTENQDNTAKSLAIPGFGTVEVTKRQAADVIVAFGISKSSDGSQIPVEGLNEEDAVQIQIPVPPQWDWSVTKEENVQVVCLWWDPVQDQWDPEGCRVMNVISETIEHTTCLCTHLTEFTVELVTTKSGGVLSKFSADFFVLAILLTTTLFNLLFENS